MKTADKPGSPNWRQALATRAGAPVRLGSRLHQQLVPPQIKPGTRAYAAYMEAMAQGETEAEAAEAAEAAGDATEPLSGTETGAGDAGSGATAEGASDDNAADDGAGDADEDGSETDNRITKRDGGPFASAAAAAGAVTRAGHDPDDWEVVEIEGGFVAERRQPEADGEDDG